MGYRDCLYRLNIHYDSHTKKRTLRTGEMAQWLKEHFLLISKTQVENLSTLVKRQLSVITASEYLIPLASKDTCTHTYPCTDTHIST